MKDLETIIIEARKEAAERLVSPRTIASLVRRARMKLYDESKRQLKERNLRNLLNSILRRIPAGIEMSKVAFILCEAAKIYNKWHLNFYGKKEVPRSAFLARAMIKDLCHSVQNLKKDYKTFTEVVKRKIREAVYSGARHHAALWGRRKKKK